MKFIATKNEKPLDKRKYTWDEKQKLLVLKNIGKLFKIFENIQRIKELETL